MMEDLYTVRAAPGKGEGCFATGRLRVGDIIMRDTDKMIIQGRKASEEQIASAFADLSIEEKAQFMRLYEGHLEYDSKVKRIWKANSFECGGKDDGVGSCMRLKLSKVNHSCSPNADCLEVVSDGVPGVFLIAIQDILPEEEILISYNDDYTRSMDRSNRRQWLSKCFGFECNCSACGPADVSISDARRRIIFALEALRMKRNPTEYLNPYNAESRIIDPSAIELLMARPDFERTTAYHYLLANFLEAEGLGGSNVGVAWKNAAVKMYNQISDAENGIIPLRQVKNFLVWLARAKQMILAMRWDGHPDVARFLEQESAMLQSGYIQVAINFLERKRNRDTAAAADCEEEHFAITFRIEADGIARSFSIGEPECNKLLWKQRQVPSLKKEANRAFWKYVDQNGFRLTLT
ncbi:hypothetical protein AC578_1875 [Pseudocercospora eumusae]|uniref:SET domain-containing protein n=1 Tax=Pseudocercospora eumusae TaxID=321146 RepID=A0A139GYJ2_9PEZI|nr:hypothetical protein AC578_1875 [Pseudocercospora eumusae]